MDGKHFEISLSPYDFELTNGTKPVVCPYDGTVFFPELSKKEKPHGEKLTSMMVRCPVDGREFKALLNVEDLLAGRSGVSLRCPYDGTKFRLSVLGTPTGQTKTLEQLTTFESPVDGRPFRVAVNPESPQSLFSPFDGTPIAPQHLIQRQAETFPRAFSGVMEPGQASIQPTELSKIEELFIRGVSQGVEKDIRQFGYNIFPKYVKGLQEENQTTASAFPLEQTLTSQNLFQGFRGLLGSNTRGGDQFGILGSQGMMNNMQTLSAIPIGPDYVVGPGDTLILNIWGSVQESMPVTVDADGKILLPKAGPVYVWGLTFSETETLIQKTLEQHYANFNISISMGRLRRIRIFVFGEASVPGTYYLSPQATVLHALYAAYGPTKLGSLRQVKLLRADKTEEVVDLYRILIQGDNSRDLPLKTNDTILIPPVGDVIGVAGNVKRPAIYETMGPVTLMEALQMGGGISASGYLQRIQVERIKNHERKVIQDFEFALREDLEKRGSAIQLQNGDLVTVFPITPQRHNFISVLGNIARPGDYELKEKMRLRDLIEKAGGVLPGSYLQRAEIARYRTDKSREIISVDLWKLLSGDETINLPLKEWDVVTIYSKSEVTPAHFVEIYGAVHEPGTYEATEGMRISDLIFRAGGLRHQASLENAELFRTEQGKPSQIIPLNLDQILQGGELDKDLYLSEGDQLFIRETLASASMGTVTLSGEFKYPGQYAIRRGETLSSLIERAGGFTEDAFLEGAIFTRKDLREVQKARLEQFLKSEQTALLQEQASLAAGYDPGQRGSRKGLFEYRETLIQDIEFNKFLGRMVVHLASPEALKGTASDIPLEDGDTLMVSRPPSSVLVVGNVYNPTALTYAKGKNATYYLRKVGGLKKNADKKHIYVIKPNGEASSQFARVKRIERGDTIVVPEEFKYKTPKGLIIKDTTAFLYQIALGAVAVAAID